MRSRGGRRWTAYVFWWALVVHYFVGVIGLHTLLSVRSCNVFDFFLLIASTCGEARECEA